MTDVTCYSVSFQCAYAVRADQDFPDVEVGHGSCAGVARCVVCHEVVPCDCDCHDGSDAT